MENQSQPIKSEKVEIFLNSMISELSFLWKEANEQEIPELKERKLRQYWEVYRIYSKQRTFIRMMNIDL